MSGDLTEAQAALVAERATTTTAPQVVEPPEVGSRQEVVVRAARKAWPKSTLRLVVIDGREHILDADSDILRTVAVAPNGLSIAFQDIDPKERTPLAPPLVVEVPELPRAPISVVGFDPGSALRRTVQRLDGDRRIAERLRQLLRSTATTHAAEVERLSGVLDDEPTMLGVSRQAAEVATLVGDFEAALDATQAHLVEVTAGHRAAVIALERAKRGETTIADLPSLATLGEVLADRLSTREVLLDELDSALDRLRRTAEELGRLRPIFRETATRHVTAVLEVTRRAAVARHTVRLQQLTLLAEAERRETLPETTAAEAAARLDPDLVRGAPTITWPHNVLDPPTLAES